MAKGADMKSLRLFAVIVAAFAVCFALYQKPVVEYNGYKLDTRGLFQVSGLSGLINKIKQTGKRSPQDLVHSCECDNVLDPNEEGAACQLEGVVPDCCCSYSAVERINRDAMKDILEELVRTPFFQYFKVDLYCECPLWPDDAMCNLRDCSVCECEPDEIPEPWRNEEVHPEQSCDSAQRESDVDRTLQPSVRAKLLSVKDWKGYHNPWMPDSDDNTDDVVDYVYINLQRNPERFTGYKGEHANRVWGAIYQQECFKDILTTPSPEKRVFYKLISGMHSSITAHVVGDYLLDEAKGIWGPNMEMFKWTLGNPKLRDRVENLYFSYLFFLRAVMKARPVLENVHYDTGMPEEDARTKELIQQLLNNEALKHSCPTPFDEGRLWKGEDSIALRQELQTAFQNITYIMDCVGCEKCKMWGKLQLLGIATSLKILFSAEDCGGEPSANGNNNNGLQLERNEVIALFNTLERLSLGVEVVRSLSLQMSEGEGGNSRVKHPDGVGAIQDVTKKGLAEGLTA